jgi:energy-coupling factor transport system permease protein
MAALLRSDNQTRRNNQTAMTLSLRYEYRDSPLHTLNPCVKLVWALSLTVISIIIEHPVYLAVMLLSTVGVLGSARILPKWVSIIKMTLYLCLAITLINVLVNHNGIHVLWQAGIKIPVLGYPEVTLEALLFSLGMSLRLLTIISVFTFVTLTVHPDDIVQTMLKVKIPPKSVLVMSLAARFLPVLIADAERISSVQQSRGVILDRGNIVQRIKNRTSVLIPLLSNSLDRTVQLAEAMESRAFGAGKSRSFYKPVRIKTADWVGLSLCFLAVMTSVIMSLNGWAPFRYYPVFDSFALNSFELWLLGLLVVLITSIIPLALITRSQQID